jgi:hypothetical protein
MVNKTILLTIIVIILSITAMLHVLMKPTPTIRTWNEVELCLSIVGFLYGLIFLVIEVL